MANESRDEQLEEVAERLKQEFEEIRREADPQKPRRKKAKKKEVESADIGDSRESVERQLTQAFHVAGTMAVDAMMLAPKFSREQARILAEAWAPVLEYYMGHSDNPIWDALIVTSIVAAPYAYQFYTRREIETVTDAQPEHPDRGATRRGKDDVRSLPTV